MRLTEKKENGFYKLKEGQEIYGEENGIRLVQIVGQLEDIEDELGIDLVTLFKALFKGIFVRQDDGGIIFWRKPALRSDIKPYCLDFVDLSVSYCPKLSDYGKSWALTRGELL